MTILGYGRANGAISILHALGLGKGCSVGLEIGTKASIVEGEPSEVPDDKHGLLEAVLSTWISEGFPPPKNFFWEVESEIPIGQGLKSSSALSCAAMRALNNFAWTGLSDFEIADLAVQAQRVANCTVTGSLDDVWASLSHGWKLVDPEKTATESILLEGEMDLGMAVLIGLRGRRDLEVSRAAFLAQSQLFERAMASIINGSPLEALSVNGMAVSAATDDFKGLRISNLSIASGAIAAGVSGSGPAIALVCYEADREALHAVLSDMEMDVIITHFSAPESVIEEAY
ncbi:MAG TPA: shikimate kinase [Candidatus Thalassarchaeaceae archaeon]|jgi:shikimate kinase|nr:shikimate kinase [Candidatus Thalassarchaeaceae archaeon]|tara:strand:- start:51110 stop:51970 length:861 start_codon:yes stop_codon:yes gene_type:complete